MIIYVPYSGIRVKSLYWIKNFKIGLEMGGATFKIEKFDGTGDFFL